MQKKRFPQTKQLLNHLFLASVCMFFMQSLHSQTQNTVTDQLADQLHNISKHHVSDLIYLQTSKSIYETEEDLWFKGYVLDAQQFWPSARSKILFVQLIEDKTKNAVWEEKYEIENGFVDGHVFLQDSLRAGTYTLAAYSSHSFYKSPKEFYAAKKVEILKTIKAIKTPTAKKDSIIHFVSFPEGGNMVSGIQTKLAFKAVNNHGEPIGVSGILFEDNKPLLEFKSSHAGMGKIGFTPYSNKNYHIQLAEAKGAKESYPIPQVQSNGKTLLLMSNNKDYALFNVSQHIGQEKEQVYLRVQVRGEVYNIATGILNKSLRIKIPLKDIPQGIAEVTLFDQDLMPIAERLIYINQEQRLYIKGTLKKSEYETKEKTSLSLKVTDQHGQPVVAHLGLSIYDRLYHSPQDTKTIETHYYLSSQLKGKLYNPAYYFDTANTNRLEALDLLLLTQGWSSYQWNETNLKQQNKLKNPVVFDYIMGHVLSEKRNRNTGINQHVVSAFATDTLKNKALIMTDTTGQFTVGHDHLKISKGGYLFLKPLAPSKPKYRIHIVDQAFKDIKLARKYKTTIYPFSKIETTELETSSQIPFTVSNDVNKLEEVVLTAKTKRIFRDKYLGKLDSLAKLDLNSDRVCPFQRGVLNCPFPAHAGGTRPVEGETYTIIEAIDLSRQSFKVIGRIEYHYPELTEAELLEKFNLRMLKGYYGKKVFYKPVYDSIEQTDGFPDYRNTLYWKPDIITDENGEAIISFYCSDINTEFLGIIEGVSDIGLLGRQTFEFFVIKREE